MGHPAPLCLEKGQKARKSVLALLKGDGMAAGERENPVADGSDPNETGRSAHLLFDPFLDPVHEQRRLRVFPETPFIQNAR